MKTKTIEEIYSSKINRTLKILYIGFFLPMLLYLGAAVFEDGDIIWLFIGMIVFARLIQIGFYYIVSGDWNPSKNEADIQNKVKEFEDNLKKSL